MSHDALNDRIVVYGGWNGSTYLTSAWALTLPSSGTPTWSQLSVSGSPPSSGQQLQACAVYDSSPSRMIVYGGYSGSDVDTDGVYQLTLPSPGTPTWSDLDLTTGPSASGAGRDAASCVYDSDSDRMVMYGGHINATTNEVWSLNLSAGSEAWTQISPTGDAGNREAHQAVYQPDYSGTDDRMIVFRGWNGSYLADVWELTLPESGSSVWTDKTPGTDYQPIKIGYGVSSSGVYDPLNMRALFIGGYDGTYYENSVYAFDLSSNPSTLAYAVLNDVRYLRERDASSMIFDSTNNQMIMFGGASRGLPGGYSYHLGETWKMNTSGTPVWRDAGAGFAPIPRELTGLKNTYFLQQLFTLLARESGSVFNLREISRKFSVSFSTVQTHLWYLHQAYLITMLRKYSRGGMAQARTQPKIHLADTGIMASLANSGREILQDQQLTGRFVETLVTATLRFNRYSAELFFWRDQRNEIDLVISSGKTVIPLEVKYRNYAMKETYSKLLDFTKKYNSPFALVLTKKEFDQKDMLIFLPAWLFCLLV